MSNWHIWVIKQNKFFAVKKFLDESVQEVEEIFFPTVLKEYKVGKRLVKKRVPLYSGYLFLKYEDPELAILSKIRANPLITTYVGVCDRETVECMKVKESWNVLSKEVKVGDIAEIKSGPMVGCKGKVVSIHGNKLTLKVDLFNREISASVSADDIEIVDRQD